MSASGLIYVELLYRANTASAKELMDFVRSVYHLSPGLRLSYASLNEPGYRALKRLKKHQVENKLEPADRPVININDEKKITANIKAEGEKENIFLLMIIDGPRAAIELTDEWIKRSTIFFDARMTCFDKRDMDKIDMVTPLNKRGDADVFETACLISNIAVDFAKTGLFFSDYSITNLVSVLGVFLDVLSSYLYSYPFPGFIDDYVQFLMEYKQFSAHEAENIKTGLDDYFPLIEGLTHRTIPFQSDPGYRILVEQWRMQLNERRPPIQNIRRKFGKKIDWQFFHWFFNAFFIPFPEEILLVFMLKAYHER